MAGRNCSHGVLLVCVLMMFWCLTKQESIVIEVIESTDLIHCSSGCCEQATGSFVCSSVDQLNVFVNNNNTLIKVAATLEIHVLCTVCNLSGLVTFENVSSLSIYGGDEATTIHCEFGDNVRAHGTGFAFKHTSNLLLSNLNFVGCGGLHRSTSKNMSSDSDVLYFRSALYFENCTNVTVSQVTIKSTSGIGLVIYDSRGLVDIESCTFESNSVPRYLDKSLPGGGGMYIEFTPCIPGMYSQKTEDQNNSFCDRNSVYKTDGQYVIQRCKFIHNRAYSLRSYLKRSGFRTFGQGGGLLISLRGNASRNTFTIEDCSFFHNSALWGGGLHLLITDFSKGNNISVSRTHFESNTATDGGGALAIYITSESFRKHAPLSENWIMFDTCNISNNSASQGGGMIIFVSIGYAEDCKSNRLEFFDTSWIANTAKSSAAVDITAKAVASTIQGPFPTFTNCKFLQNKVISSTKSLDGGHATQSNYGKASFLVTFAKLFFNDSVVFYGNNATALYISAGVESFSENIVAKFERNYGVRGGAVALIASSYLEVRRNSHFQFISNHAYVKGGAIYSYSIGEHELHDHILSLGCFIQYRYRSNDISTVDRQLNFMFERNSVISSSNYGRSIFSASLLACASDCHGDYSVLNASTALSCVANFTFINSSAEDQVSTTGSKFIIEESLPSEVIPGKKFKLHIFIIDALNNSENTILRSYIKPLNHSRIAIDSADNYIADNTLRIYGSPGARGRVHLEKVDYRTVDLSFDIRVIQCPPGYILFTSHTDNSKSTTDHCVCAWDMHVPYRGFLKCNHTLFQAYILHGFWAGYSSENESEDTLFTAYCPLNFCSYNESQDPSYFYLLPSDPNRIKLSKYICSNNRNGWLCGSCIDGYSVYFHSPNYRCGPDINCGVGPLLYILSELVPLTLLFTAIMVLRINFTSGSLTGFIFYAQVIDGLLLDVNSMIGTSRANSQWSFIPNWLFLLIYRILNLNFFAINSLSFCLWKSATTLDIIVFKYVTITFAFMLVLATRVLMNCFNFYRCHKCCNFCRRFSVQSSVIHSISTFLVMCFAQCVQVSFLLLTPGHIYGKGGKIFQSRLLYHGDISMYSVQHAVYATSAFVCILLLVILPTILLLWYPSGPRLLTFCGLGDSWFMKCLNKAIPLHKLKPFFDSFQSCFKDNFRFFSGLYFSYRLLIIAAYSFSIGLTQFYITVEVLLITMLMFHALAQPYKKRLHNVIDTLTFSNLTFINALSILIYIKSSEKLYKEMITAAIHIQTFLISLPLIVMSLFLIFYFVVKLKQLIIKKKLRCQSSADSVLSNEFPPRLVNSDDSDGSSDYNLLEEETVN